MEICWYGCVQSAFKWKFCWYGCTQSAFKWKNFADMAVPSQLSSGKILLIWLCPVSFQVEILLIWLYPVSFQVENHCCPDYNTRAAKSYSSSAYFNSHGDCETNFVKTIDLSCWIQIVVWKMILPIYKKFDFNLIKICQIFSELKKILFKVIPKRKFLFYLIILFLKFIVLAYQIFHSCEIYFQILSK